MVIEQEMAEIYPPAPEDLSEYLPDTDCGKCGFESCLAFAEAVLSARQSARSCSELDEELAQLVDRMVGLKKEPIPYNIMMEQAPCELIEINAPDKNSPLLVTCNFRETVSIMTSILEKTGSRVFLLPTHTHGYSVDNAVPERMFKALEVWKAIQDNTVSEKVARNRMIIPGLAESEKNAIRQLTRWEILVGPVSGFLTPLFLWENGLWN
ncbi:MAG: (Fe-S)-binding protein [Deltaproteobacteria bacterium]|nr:(Fe-S)-binding protein [Deltaproteobacteria bacterium]